MTAGLQRESAKIYQFPSRGRMAAGGRREDAKPALELTLPRASRVEYGSGWYHEAAIQEAEQGRRR